MSKRYDDPIEVEVAGQSEGFSALDSQPEALVAFYWRGRRYSVDRLLKYWKESSERWDPKEATDNELFRVEAEGGTYDLRLDRLAGRRQPKPDGVQEPSQWRLARVWD